MHWGFNHISSEQSPDLPESPQVLDVSRNTFIELVTLTWHPDTPLCYATSSCNGCFMNKHTWELRFRQSAYA